MSYEALGEAVKSLQYKQGWRFKLVISDDRLPITQWLLTSQLAIMPHETGTCIYWPQTDIPLVLFIWVETVDSNHPDYVLAILHQFDVPALPNKNYEHLFQWERWLFDRIMEAELHEAMEFFEVSGYRPYYPDHTKPAEDRHRNLYTLIQRHQPGEHW